MRILVTGGAGYIGSVVTEQLVNDGHQVVVYDSLYKGHRAAIVDGAAFIQAELSDNGTLRRTLREHRVEAVMHMAADSLVGESIVAPEKYYQNNVATGLTLLEAMRECSVDRLVFSSTAAVFGEPEKQPIKEDDPTSPTNPYGESKLAFEKALRWFELAYGLRYVSLRYFNAAGASGRLGECHHPETHLIPLVLQGALGRIREIKVHGDDYPTRDGTCVRDYIHVVDLARAHVLALGVLQKRSAVYNLGCGGEGYTVREVVEAATEVTGVDIPIRIGARRVGDPATLIASSDKIKHELNWRPQFQDLREIIRSAWTWTKLHPGGYEVGKV